MRLNFLSLGALLSKGNLQIILSDEKEMSVQFGETRVRNNQTLPLQIAQQPLVIDFQGDPNRLYTLLFYDLSSPHGTYMHHQISNFRGSDFSTGNVIFTYEPPNPPPQSGIHTYIVEIDEQSRPLPSERNNGGRAPVPLNQLRLVAGLTPVSQVSFQIASPGAFSGPTSRSRAALTTGYSCGCGNKPKPVRVETTGHSCGCSKKPKPVETTGYSCGCGKKPKPIETTGHSCGCGKKPKPIIFGYDNGYTLQATGSSSGDASGTGGQYSIMPTGFFGVPSSTNDYPGYIIRDAGTGQSEGLTSAQLRSFNRGDILIGEGTQSSWAGSRGFPRTLSSQGSSTPLGSMATNGTSEIGQDYSGQGSGFLDQNTAYPGLPTGILGMGNSNGTDGRPLPMNGESDWFIPDAPLSEADRSYCRCTVEVAGKQPLECNLGQTRPGERAGPRGRRCVNPYAVCHSSVQGEGGFPDCTRYFDFSKIPDRELYGYISSRKVPFPVPAPEQYDRLALISQLENWRGEKEERLSALGVRES